MRSLTNPSDVEVVEYEGQTEILATTTGEASLFLFTLADGIPIPDIHGPLEPRGQFAEVQPLGEAGLFLVATFVTDVTGVERPTPAPVPAVGSSVLLAMLITGAVGPEADDAAADDNRDDDGDLPEGNAPGTVSPHGLTSESPSPLNDFLMRIDEGIRAILDEMRGERRAGDR